MKEHNVMAFYYTEQYGKAKEDKVALFDSRDLSAEDVEYIIKNEINTDKLIIMTVNAYNTVFRSLR